MRIYSDGVFDLFHIGHVESLHKHPINFVVHGFVNDDERTRQESFYEQIKNKGNVWG